MEAASNGNVEIARMLIERGMDVNTKVENGIFKGWTALIRAADNGHTEMVKELVYAGANLYARIEEGGYMGYTALMFCGKNKEEPARFLQDMANLHELLGKENSIPFYSSFNECIKQ